MVSAVVDGAHPTPDLYYLALATLGAMVFRWGWINSWLMIVNIGIHRCITYLCSVDVNRIPLFYFSNATFMP